MCQSSFHGIKCKNKIYQTPTICQALGIRGRVRESSGTQANHRCARKPMIICWSPVHLTFYFFLRKKLQMSEWSGHTAFISSPPSVFPHRLFVLSSPPHQWHGSSVGQQRPGHCQIWWSLLLPHSLGIPVFGLQTALSFGNSSLGFCNNALSRFFSCLICCSFCACLDGSTATK